MAVVARYLIDTTAAARMTHPEVADDLLRLSSPDWLQPPLSSMPRRSSVSGPWRTMRNWGQIAASHTGTCRPTMNTGCRH